MKGAVVLGVCLLAGLALAAEVPYLGVGLSPVGSELASYLGIDGGALVNNVEKGSPAEKAGLRVKDIIVMWNRKAVKGPEDLAAKVRSSKIGSSVPVEILRKGKRLTLKVQLGKRTAPEAEAEKPGYLGVAFGPVPPAVRDFLELGDQPGVAVIQVLPGSPARKAGLKERDIIRKVNGKPVRGPEEFRKMISARKAGEKVKLQVLRRGKELSVTVTLGERPPEFKRFKPPCRIPFVPRIEKGKGKIILKWKSPDGKEHEETIEIPSPEQFEFHFPELPDFPEGTKWREYLERSLQEARRRIQEFSREMRRKHEALKEKLRSGRTIQFGGAPESKIETVQVTKSGSFVMYSDGTYEISIKTEDGNKTVTVKKNGKVLAKDLPYKKIGTLPSDVQRKIKELEKGIKIEVRTKVEGPGKLKEEKKILKLPTQRI